jgi:uncharacterized protein YfdQ (DUF2303 family)
MDKTAIQEIQRLSIAEISNKLIVSGAVVIPQGQSLVRLEQFKMTPDHFRATFKTNIVSEFIAYVNAHGTADSGIFIDQNTSKALAIIDLGDHQNPQWGKHKAEITLKNQPDYDALLGKQHQWLDQQAFIDFAEDWPENIVFFDADDNALNLKEAVKTLRKLKVNFNSENEQTVNNFSASRSALESIEIKAGNDDLPSGFIFNTIPHDGFSAVELVAQLRSKTVDKSVKLQYRIARLDQVKDEIANEFRDKITTGIITDSAPIFIGTIDYQ